METLRNLQRETEPRRGNLVLMFPGQGAASPGMGTRLALHPAGAAVFREADEILRYPLFALMSDTQGTGLSDNAIAQPAIVATSIAAYGVLQAEHPELKHVEPVYYIGHSLGELTALYISGVLGFEDTLKIAQERGRLMQKVATETPGGMVAVKMNKEKDGIKVFGICRLTGADIAVYNSPQQITISGLANDIINASELLEDLKFSALPLLNVPPSHTRYMKPAKQGLATFLEENHIIFHDPPTPVIMCATGKEVDRGEDARKLFLEQLVSPVRFEQGIFYAWSHGIGNFVEIGPKKLLAKFIPQINPNLKQNTVYDIESARSVDLSTVI